MKIAVIGSVMVDLMSYADMIPAAGETREVQAFSIGCGGKGANQAIAAARLGADVMMLARVGDDMFGEKARQNFVDYHVDTRYVLPAAGVANGMATVLVESSSQNRILIYKGANQYLTAADIEAAAPDLKKCSLLLLQLEIDVNTVYAAIAFANKHSIPVLLNPAPAIPDLSIEMACKCDFFVPNETELSILTGLPVDTDAAVKTAAQSLIDRGLKNIIVTMGERGSLWLTQEQCVFVAAHKVEAVDTTGAGDAFIGCFADAYVKTADVVSSMKRAAAFAALSVTKRGTQVSYPDAAALDAFVAAQNNS